MRDVKQISGDENLLGVAEPFVRPWRFRPYKIEGKASAVSTTVHFDYDNAREKWWIRYYEEKLIIGDYLNEKVTAPTFPKSLNKECKRDQCSLELRIWIGTDGAVKRVDPAPGDDPDLFDFAKKSLLLWKFHPIEIEGRVSDMITKVHLDYHKLIGPG